MTLSRTALGLVVTAFVLAACGTPDVDTSAIPTSAPSDGSSLCGALPRSAVTLATATSHVRIEAASDDLRTMRSADSASCYIDEAGSDGRRLVDVTFQTGAQSDNEALLRQFEQGPKKNSEAVPADLGTGILTDPWSSESNSAQVTMTDGGKRLQIAIVRGPSERDQGKDVLALARLLEPYFG
ncbi:hypothetical protein D9V37_15040 [Nocardioides mangrovicus]|uniref:DUF3558 domain-containing protein n=1 Tax=Nocardioides mangrovicus TaxID=2478913 RepID=A0A3L8NZG7_9ACTN|nr:hypothetical protein [Nocardioides mangrovicus]RLV47498.1 hypothetical protein D9V37_15040 [Nocardioides mangrovicus]